MTSTARKITSRPGWHWADVKAAMAKKGYTLMRIGRENGYAANSPSMVRNKPWPQMERIIAGIAEVPPFVIWPDRYDKYGKPIKERTARIKPQIRIAK